MLVKALLLSAGQWVKVTVEGWVPGNMVGSPSAIYWREDDKDRTLHSVQLYIKGVSQLRRQ